MFKYITIVRIVYLRYKLKNGKIVVRENLKKAKWVYPFDCI